jgi:hypothetical protein
MAFGQIVNFQGGTSISKLDWEINNMGNDYFNEPIVGYSFFLGIDYCNNNYFNLSSNIGALRKGGSSTMTFTSDPNDPGITTTETAKLDYISFNTTLDLKYPIKERFIPFISVGPRLDYLANYSKEFDGINDLDALNKFTFGMLLGGGLKYNLSQFQLGVRADYYLNFNQIAEWPVAIGNLGGKINDNTYTINLSIGYKLK